MSGAPSKIIFGGSRKRGSSLCFALVFLTLLLAVAPASGWLGVEADPAIALISSIADDGPATDALDGTSVGRLGPEGPYSAAAGGILNTPPSMFFLALAVLLYSRGSAEDGEEEEKGAMDSSCSSVAQDGDTYNSTGEGSRTGNYGWSNDNNSSSHRDWQLAATTEARIDTYTIHKHTVVHDGKPRLNLITPVMSLGFTALLLARHALLIVIPTIPTASAAATSVCTDKGYPIACAAPSSNATVCLATGECPKECPGLRVEDVHEDKCVDRRIFDEWRKYDIPALFIWFISSGLAVSAGVGGGGIFVPLGILLLRFSTKASTGLSQASIFGASLAGFILNSRARHPKAPRPLIDFDMALFLAPMEMAGALLGALIQMILPTWLVIIIMSLVLGLTSAKTFARGIRVYREERQSRAFPTREDGPEVNTPNGSQPCDGDGKAEGFRNEHGVASAQECDEGPLPSLVSCSRGGCEGVSTSPCRLPPDDAASDSAVVREQWKDRDARQYPLEKYWKLAMVWATIILLLLLRGGKGTE
ncbi:hypothetical protein FOL46_003053 [Perkinsus olseni]|nr:hypothetical protein FOL46_003053 [Perkinsus olseni]